MRTLKHLIESIVRSELAQINEESDKSQAKQYIDWLKSLTPPQERPTGWKVGRLKKEKLGKKCAFCNDDSLLSVEHIIPRGIGGPKFERWNLAWSCRSCNDARGSNLGPPQTNRPMTGWLGQALAKQDIPTKDDLINFFQKNETPKKSIAEQSHEKETEEITDPVYHVTHYNRLEGISNKGLAPGSTRSIGGGAYDSHAKQGIFLTDPDGVSFWFDKSEQFAEHNSDNPYEDGLVPVVLRIDPTGLESDLMPDDIGSDDAQADAHIYPGVIDTLYIEVWDGSSWISVDDYWDVDTEQSFDIEEDEETGETYYIFKSDNPLLPD